MQRLLRVAVQEGIKSDFARQLAHLNLDLALLDDGTPLPLLHIRTLGGLSLQVGNRTILRGEELTPHQRQLLTLLLAGPGLHLSQEEIAGQLWPDSPEHKARKNFDSLLIRLRKTLSEAVVSCGIRHSYLVMRKGVLGLEHTWVDALIFREEAAKALRHLRDGEPMQADNAFRRVVALWDGPFMASLPLPESADAFRQELSLLYLKCVRCWCPLLTADGRHAEAEEIVVTALRFDPINEDLVRFLHGIYTARNNLVKARQLLEAYARALSEASFSEEEIEEILEAFWTHPA
jgi:DNA-binding SARP family transcriptional activator